MASGAPYFTTHSGRFLSSGSSVPLSVVVSSTFLLAIAARAAAMGKVVRMRLSGVARIRDGKGRAERDGARTAAAAASPMDRWVAKCGAREKKTAAPAPPRFHATEGAAVGRIEQSALMHRQTPRCPAGGPLGFPSFGGPMRSFLNRCLGRAPKHCSRVVALVVPRLCPARRRRPRSARLWRRRPSRATPRSSWPRAWRASCWAEGCRWARSPPAGCGAT